MLKKCKKHGYVKHSIQGNNENKRIRCLKCAVEAVQRKRIKLKNEAIKYKGGKCERCGYDKCAAALEFHHLDPNKKDFGIAAKGYTRSLEKIKIELDKCMMLCANCHREIHSDS